MHPGFIVTTRRILRSGDHFAGVIEREPFPIGHFQGRRMTLLPDHHVAAIAGLATIRNLGRTVVTLVVVSATCAEADGRDTEQERSSPDHRTSFRVKSK